MEQNETFSGIRKTFRPLLLGMTLAGLYHDSNKENCSTGSGEILARTRTCQKHLARCYHLFITVLMVINAIRYIPSFWVGMNYVEELTIPRVITCGWLIQCAINGIILFVMCEKRNQMPEFTSHYNALMTDDTAKCIKLKYGCNKLKIYAWLAILSAIFFVLPNVIAQIVLSFVNKGFRASLVNPLDHDNIPVTILMIIPLFFASCAWIMPIFFFIGISSTISLQFKTLNNIFAKTFKEDHDSQMVCFKHIRRKHNQLCQAVDILDRSFKFLIMNYFSINVFLSMFIAYHLINGAASDTFTFAVNLTWFTVGVIMILVISIYSTNITQWAHAPLDLTYDLQLGDIASHQVADLNLFLTRLTASPIGFTVMGLVTVTKEMILTLSGIFMTYFFLLLQFKIV